MGGIAGQEQSTEAHRLGDEAAQRRDALFDRRTDRHARGDLRPDPPLELVPEALVAPLVEMIFERTLHVTANPRRRAHACQRETAVGRYVDQLVPGRRHIGQDAQPAERIDALVSAELARRNAAAADAVIAVAARDEVAFEASRLAAMCVRDGR